MEKIYPSLLFLLACLASFASAQEAELARTRPNFLIVVADDLGWSDIGALGGEILTPTLDGLADAGTLMTDFYVAPTCSPTRSMLLTGVDNHLAGVGTMHGFAAPNQHSRYYAGQLHSKVVTVAEALSEHGYATFLSGKWHLAVDPDQRPHRRGFQRSFSLIGGAASHFADKLPISPREPVLYLEDGKEVALPTNFYSTIYYTDKMLRYLDERDSDTPFFAYLAYTAPHDPLQVPDDWLNRYRGAYAKGPVALRAERAEKQSSLGLIPAGVPLWQMPNFPWWFPIYRKPWDERDADLRGDDERRMEIYAAMVELMDQQIGRIVNKLEEQGVLENTYIIFLSDNGPSAIAPRFYPGATDEWIERTWGNSTENRGKRGNFTVMGGEWASVSATPWRLFKGQVGEGGIRSPLIVVGPKIVAGQVTSALGHVTDITPTIFTLADIQPGSDPLYRGKLQPQGTSLLPIWSDQSRSVRHSFAVELFGNRAIRDDRWKATLILPPAGSGEWQLFDLVDDPGETRNLASERPEVLKRLLNNYDGFVQSNGVIPPVPPPSIGDLRKANYRSCDWWCDLRFDLIEWYWNSRSD